jgi:hypothetical protein
MNNSLPIFTIVLALLSISLLPDPSQAQIVERTYGSFGPHIAVGSVNGVRLGVRYFAHPAFAIEAAAGYMQVTLLRENERKEYTDGMSITFGTSWFTHPEATISPMVSLLGVFMVSTALPAGFSQTRFAIVPSFGSEYYFHRNYSVFFRFGPAFQYTTEQEQSRFEMTTQFDAGISIIL